MAAVTGGGAPGTLGAATTRAARGRAPGPGEAMWALWMGEEGEKREAGGTPPLVSLQCHHAIGQCNLMTGRVEPYEG